jgi:antirestriction protein ArdC
MNETKNDVYQIVTDRVIELLEKGTVPWRKAWAQGEDFPSNLVSKKKYRGMGAAYLSATAGILHRTIDNSAAYINGWLERLKNDRKLVVNAASAAHRATDYILGVKYANE